MVRHKTSLLKRKTQVMQQRTHVLAVVEHAELPPDQHPNEHGGPTGRLTAHDKRTGLNQLDQAFLLTGGQLWATPTAVLVRSCPCRGAETPSARHRCRLG